MKRRTVIALAAAGVGTTAVPLAGCGLFNKETDTVGNVPFDNRLKIPPLAEHTEKGGAKHFELAAAAGETEFKPGGATATWGYNGSYLGPTIRARRGDDLRFTVRNHLEETTTVHFHGAHLPAEMDGGPHQPIEPGGTWEPEWTVDQPATMLWYHPHPHGNTARHIFRGLSGLIYLDDDASDALDLPREYGVDDVPLIVQDRTFDGANQFDEDEDFSSSTGIHGDEILVNGTYGPYFEATTRRLRLRILNGSNARLYTFGLSDERDFQIIGSDGGLLSAPVTAGRITLSPAERTDLVVELRPGETVDLRSYPVEVEINSPFDRNNGLDDSFDILRIRAADELADSPEVPGELIEVPSLAAEAVAAERSFALQSPDSINGESMDMNRIDFGTEVDTVEEWTVRSTDGFQHNFHVHDVQFQVASLNGEEPPAHLRGWKDTVLLEGNGEAKLLMRFTAYTDPDVPYMYHCHILLHEDQGMMGQFVVLGHGEDVGTVSAPSSGHGGHG
ncbi:multicopper oxidase family protein [Salininema proteolyticum]|uniref:Multicopper oxidase family protein n=1 Tax=Salininema proteolyticum TaxID=1607685 RepID=A0ABV8TXZ1_9ACTN